MPRKKTLLPVMPLRSTAVYPSATMSIQIGMEPTLAMLAAHPDEGLEVIAVIDLGEGEDAIEAKALEKIGILARITDRLYMPGGSVQATIQGLRRVRIHSPQRPDGFWCAVAEEVEEIEPDPGKVEDLITRILSALETLSDHVERISTEIPAVLRMNVGKPGRFADLVATLAHFTVAGKDEVIQRLDIQARLAFVLEELEGELVHIREVEAAEAQPKPPRRPRERAAEIRRRIKRLQVELGQIDPAERETVQLLRRIEASHLPTQVAGRARHQVERLRTLGAGGPEAEDIRMYVDWLLHMPWTASAVDHPGIDLEAVRKVLDEQLLGLDEPKDRLLDDLAVAQLRGDLVGPIPCIVGPPDVGKSSLAAAIAAGLERPLASIDLAGRGETDLIGARRTQRDAKPGKIAEALRDHGVRDPLILLESLDLIGVGKVEGDPAQALAEALGWNGKRTFLDRYLDVEFDLSHAVVLATAQDFQRIPRNLRELLVEIRIAGYTPEEKVAIALQKLLPRMIEEHGLQPSDVSFTEASLFALLRGYARDAGLERTRRLLATLLRTRARAKALGDADEWSFEENRIEQILGPPRHVSTAAESTPEVGVVTGLAWTAAGGELLFIEALRMAGKGRLLITGFLGDVMKESVNAAYSYVRSRARELGIPDSEFGEIDVHVHFPVGAVPKDGPSAGMAVTLAVASTLSGLAVRHDIAMTGEVTLRGKILEVGGIKEKVLAAYRAGILEIILPAGNERDLRDVPENVRSAIKFHYVERMDQVMDLALLGGPRADDAPVGDRAEGSKRKPVRRHEKRASRQAEGNDPASQRRPVTDPEAE